MALYVYGLLSIISSVAAFWTPYAVITLVIGILNTIRLVYPVWRQGLPKN